MRFLAAAVIGLGFAAMPATAAVQTIATGGVSFAATPFTYDFGGGNTLTFTNTGDFFAPEGVSTGGNLQIGSFGAPFYDPPQPTSYFTNRGGSFGPDVISLFLPYASPAAVAFSISEGLVGFRFDLGGGYQYGYADTAGTNLYGFRIQTTPGLDVALGAVPEPATWALLFVGFGLTGVAVRRAGGARRPATARS